MAQRRVLIPTDLSVESLNVLRGALHTGEGDDMHIILTCGVHLSESIRDLLFFSKQKMLDTLITSEFKSAVGIIENRFASRIKGVRYELYTGHTHSAFSNFIEGHRINEAFIPQTYRMNHRHSRYYDVVPYILKSGMKATPIEWTQGNSTYEANNVSGLFPGLQ